MQVSLTQVAGRSGPIGPHVGAVPKGGPLVEIPQPTSCVLLEYRQLFPRRQTFVITSDLDSHGPDGSAPAGSIFQAQAIQDGTGEADGKAVTGADSIDDVLDVIARHAVFLVIAHTYIGPMTAAHLDDEGLSAAL